MKQSFAAKDFMAPVLSPTSDITSEPHRSTCQESDQPEMSRKDNFATKVNGASAGFRM